MSVHQKFWLGANLQSRRWLLDRRLDAVERNDVCQLDELLSNQRPFHPKELSIALQTAILKKSDEYSECIELLLSYGADPRGKDGSGTPFIVVAAEACCLGILELILKDERIDVNQVREDGSTALHRAAWQNHVECVRLLLQAGGDTDMQDIQGRTPFLLAAQGDRSEVMEILLQSGCDPAIPDNKARTAIYWAARYDSSDVIAFLLEEDSDVRNAIDTQDFAGNTALMVAAQREHVESLQVLIKHGADVDIRNKEGSTALLAAARAAHVEIASILIEAGADVNVTDDALATPLIYLSAYPGVVRQLIQAGADLNHIAKSQNTPLRTAVISGTLESVRLLIQSNCTSGKQSTQVFQRPMKDALLKGRLDIIKVLFRNLTLAGCDTRWLRSYILEDVAGGVFHRNPDVKQACDWVLEQCELPRSGQSLQVLCRNRVRSVLIGPSFFQRVQSLPIPTALKLYLHLPELEDVNL